jgi:hypothetical protein
MFGQKQRKIEQQERIIRDLRIELAGVQELFRRGVQISDDLRALVSKQARELLALETAPKFIEPPPKKRKKVRKK